jgi:dihydrofolate synthase / folylpolyglutamate synthase
VSTNVAWLETLSPWPTDGFGTERMRALLADLGDPQGRLPTVHVVGTNGKSTTTRMVEELLLAGGVRAGAYLSPHIRSWSERIRVCGREADLESALGAVRPAAELRGATQFEALTAAAFVAFRTADVEAAAVEAGLGGRHDATNVLDATRVVVLTNVSLEHTEVLGATREAIAAEKLAVVRPGCVVVLGEAEWADAALAAGAGRVVVAGEPGLERSVASSGALAVAAAEAFLGHAVDARRLPEVRLPGRLERRPGEVRDGAHNPEGVRWLVDHLPPGDYTVMASILADKDADAMLGGLSGLGRRFVACRSSSPRALAASDLADRARRWFAEVHARDDPREALTLARGLGEPVLVTGSLYLLADLAAAEGVRA